MSMVGQLTYFLGLQVKQSTEGYNISQEKYAKNLVKKFDLESCKTPRTPISTSTKVSKDDTGASVDNTVYRSLIGILLYLTASQPDIMFSVGMCARYQSDPKESHLIAAKRILKYIKGTIQYGLWYSKDNELSLSAYCDADWAGNIDDKKRTSGECFFVGKNLVSWLSKKHNSISLSTAEAEYIVAGGCCTQLVWMKQMLLDYGLTQRTMTLYCDNRLGRIKGDRIGNIQTDKQLADILTKPLDANRFEILISALGICRIDQ
ncbi:PREDICTED: uncharacterized protein LOC109168060 [Ipomoea nil]|uniref:uncharacterized protein LOC109168060 n=1 Tax=Ipomoea nil TaxID=35883 RepID=UPI000900BF18|nr:PREDICTED: uncharacterized protein LOC109168060 [Ipomoea nil]